MYKQNPSNHIYITSLDGLRAIAVIGVLLYHLNPSLLPGGFLGVTVFFVLSGYLITDLLHTEWKQNKRVDLLNFWLRRFRRLLPALVLLLTTVAVWVAILDPTYFNRIKEEFLISFLYINNWWYIYQEVSYSNSFGPLSPLTHIWSLAVEEQFYLFWPMLLLAILIFIKKRIFQVIVILFIALLSAALMAYFYVPGTDPSRVYYGTDTRAFSLLLGAALAFILPKEISYIKINRAHQLSLEVIGGLGLLIIIGMFCFTSFYDSSIYQGGMLLLSIATVGVIIALLQPTSYLTRIVNINLFQWVGKRSYGIYLWHFPIIILTTPVVNTGSYELGRIALQIISTLIVSDLSYRYIENPIRQKGFKGYIQTLVSRLSLLQKRFITYTVTLAVASGFGIVIAMINHTAEQNMTVGASYTEKIEIEAAQIEYQVTSIQLAEEETIVTTPKSITIIGDSILYDVAPHFLTYYPEAIIDYKVGRQMHELPDIIHQLEAERKLGDIIVIQIGTNGAFDKQILENSIVSLGYEKKIFLVNTRVPKPWQGTVNNTLFDVAHNLPNTTLVDWYSISENKEFFKSDYVHLTEIGAKTYANLLIDVLDTFNNLNTATIQ